MDTDYRTIPLSGRTGAGLEVKVSPEDYGWASKRRWYITKLGYVYRPHRINPVPGDWRRTFVLMHRAVLKPDDRLDVHHLNHDKLDNRRSNLIACTRAEHMARYHGWGSTSSRPGGAVDVEKRRGGRYRVRVRQQGRRVTLGTFDTVDEASACREQYLRNRALGIEAPIVARNRGEPMPQSQHPIGPSRG